MYLEIDHFYSHADGRVIRVMGQLLSAKQGACLVAEQSNRLDFIRVAADDTAEWQETSRGAWLKACARVDAEAVVAGSEVTSSLAAAEFLHPVDHPPERGTPMLLYMYPYGGTIVGQWQSSGASLWAPFPRIGPAMRKRLEDELEARNRARTTRPKQ